MRATRTDALWLALGVASLVTTALIAIGVSPAATSLIAMVAISRACATRWGYAAAIAAAFAMVVAATFVTVSFAAAIPWALPFEVALAQSALIWAAPCFGAPRRIARADVRRALPDALAAAAGSLCWLIAVAFALVLPTGSGLSWAAYVDSSLDMFSMRQIVRYGGLDLGAMSNPRPLEHALSASAASWPLNFDSAPSTVAAALDAHATAWSAYVALACLFAGLIVNAMLLATGIRPWLRRLLVASTSLSLLLAPITGVALYRGQMNAHLTWALCFAAVLVALHARRSPAAAIAIQLLIATEILLTWTPFAAIPAALAVVTVIENRRRLHRWGSGARLAMLLGAGFTVWAIVTFSWQDLVGAAVPGAGSNLRRVAVETVFAVPAYLPLTLGLLVIVALTGALSARGVLPVGRVGLAVAGGVGLVLIYLGASGGLSMVPTTYYPARYQQMASVVLLPVAIGGTAVALARARIAWRAVTGVVVCGVAVAAVAAPAAPVVAKLGFTPVNLMTGTWFGTREQMADRIVDFTDEQVARLAWRLEPEFDVHVNWMLSLLEPKDSWVFDSAFRAAIRNDRDNLSTAHACVVAEASERPVVFVTSDPALEPELENLCPDVDATVHLETSPP